MRRGDTKEGPQRQGLGTIIKPLEERYGKTDESQRTTLRKFKTSVVVQQPAIRDQNTVGNFEGT